MHICFDTRMSRSWDAGTGRLTISLLDHLAVLDSVNEYTILLHPQAPEISIKYPERFRIVTSSIPPASVKQLICLPLWIRRNGIDLIFHTHPLSMGIWQPCRAIGSILDILPIRFPKHFPFGAAYYYKTIVRQAAAHKDAIVTISCHTRKDAIETLKLQPNKIRVIYLAPADHLRPVPDNDMRRTCLSKYGINQPYILYHGNTRPHKNLAGLLIAFKLMLSAKGPTHELVITGREVPRERERNFDNVRAECYRLGIQGHVRFTGYLEEEDLPFIYSGANLFVLPSLYEGFGLPVLEAMACGTPVVCSNTSSLPEITQDAALLVDPLNPEAIADAILRLLSDGELHKELSRRGLSQAGHFSWKIAAQQMLDLFRDVCQRSGKKNGQIKNCYSP